MIKTEKNLKVYSSTNVNHSASSWARTAYTEVPQIILRGKWLKDVCGIDIADHVKVRCEDNKIVITKE